jgi:hypothetical protein
VKRGANLDPNLAKHPPEGMQLSPDDKKALVAFLRSLTDTKLPALLQAPSEKKNEIPAYGEEGAIPVRVTR